MSRYTTDWFSRLTTSGQETERVNSYNPGAREGRTKRVFINISGSLVYIKR